MSRPVFEAGCLLMRGRYGGTDHELWDTCEKEGTLSSKIPINHSGLFYPVIQPTLTVAVDAYAVGALTWTIKK